MKHACRPKTASRQLHYNYRLNQTIIFRTFSPSNWPNMSILAVITYLGEEVQRLWLYLICFPPKGTNLSLLLSHTSGLRYGAQLKHLHSWWTTVHLVVPLSCSMRLQQDVECWTDEKTWKEKLGKNQNRRRWCSEQPRPEAKSLFDSLKVVSLPAFLSPLLLVVRDASVLHLQLRRTAQVHKRHGDGGVMLWNQQSSGLRWGAWERENAAFRWFIFLFNSSSISGNYSFKSNYQLMETSWWTSAESIKPLKLLHSPLGQLLYLHFITIFSSDTWTDETRRYKGHRLTWRAETSGIPEHLVWFYACTGRPTSPGL